MYREDLFFWAVSIGVSLGLLTAIVTCVLMWRHGGNSTGDIIKYTISGFITPALLVVAFCSWWFGDLPPREFKIVGVADQSVTSAADFAAGTHCLAGPAEDRHHQGIRNRFERYSRKYTSRMRLKIESETMGTLIEDGNAAGLHVYSILYNYRETRESEEIGLKVKRKEYWVRSADCFASSKSTSRNLQAVFGG